MYNKIKTIYQDIPFEANILTEYGYKTVLSLNMTKSIDSKGYARWLDNGMSYDSVRTDISVVDGGGNIASMTALPITEKMYITQNIGGFFPFSPMFSQSNEVPILIQKHEYNGRRNTLGEEHTYSLEIVPDVKNISYLGAGYPIDQDIVKHWTLTTDLLEPDNYTAHFPCGEFRSRQNENKKTINFNGANSQIVDTYRLLGSTSQIKINCNEEQARVALMFFRDVMRGTDVILIDWNSSDMFGQQALQQTASAVRLYDNKITITHNNYGSIDLEFTLQIVGYFSS